MKKQQYIPIEPKLVFAAFAILFLTLQSCQNSEETLLEAGEATVNVSMVSVDSNVEEILLAGTKNSKVSSNLTSDVPATIAFSNSSTIGVSLTSNASSTGNLLASSGKVATTGKVPLTKGVKYNVVVYSDEGNYVTEKSYTYGNESTTGGITLYAGKNYTFVAYSINNSSALPNLVNKNKLSTAKIDQVSADLMYFKTKLKIEFGVTNLNVVLKHQFSEITTVMTMDPNTTGAFTKIASAVMKPTHSTATLSLEDDKITYNGENKNGASVTFPSLGTKGLRSVTSVATMLINPSSTTGSLNFGSITIDGETKSNVNVANLKVKPGYKYNLNLNFKTCTKDVSGADGLNWRYPQSKNFWGEVGIYIGNTFYKNGETISKTITAPGADYGFLFDITELDNAFNMEVNGVKLATKEIQFQRVNGSSSQNIRFKDGSRYEGSNTQGGDDIAAVYNMKGTEAKPLVKIVISRFGEVTMFGSKVNGGPLYELELFNGNTFNTFPWSGTGTNTVKVTQLVDGRTFIVGKGSGKTKISCN
ncbi:hypothetical protein [Sphingobacterium hungaricum]|uniref:Fimbrillin-like n=1 Tax=Sphingobacterium hungaricum TaxID=2082723 RepID=A0A928YPT0_9SPHI|nr:hypothetical protein [Sphingobacterium hungaricum]MBE8712215.1 hypothetical protein [Sphingobacterium hungaricum]